MSYSNKTFTLTFCDRAENHKGMQMIGDIANHGFTLQDLKATKHNFEVAGYKSTLVKLNKLLPADVDADNAYILIIRNGVDCILGNKGDRDDLFTEQDELDHDKKAFMYGRVVNKHARHNLCFSDVAQEPDYEDGKGRIVAFDDVPLTKYLRNNFKKYIPDKAAELQAEGNYYYDVNKCGIGYHGDSERVIVIGVRLGETLSLHYQWYHNSQAVGKNLRLELHHGDVYLMSEKATGNDWKKKLIYTLRHAAGCNKYTDL
uniref:Alpha-ketoglutarate-dependent dioxygenase AlkB-like domain-containing protein n=1 Tax=viral metagenome TaxID=1070528 RepID=A0A6C0CBB0_9ZZZZ